MPKSIPIKPRIRLWNTFFIGMDLLCLMRHLLNITFFLQFGFEELELIGVFHLTGVFILFTSILLSSPFIARGKKIGLYWYIILVPVRFYTGLFTFSVIKDFSYLKIDEFYITPNVVFAILALLEIVRLIFTVRVYSKYLPRTNPESSELIDN